MPKVRGNVSRRRVVHFVMNFFRVCQQDFDIGFYRNHCNTVSELSFDGIHGFLSSLFAIKSHSKSVLIYIL